MSDIQWFDSLEAANSAALERETLVLTYIHAPG